MTHAASEPDVTNPSPARVYNHLLGGKDNYPVDRDAARAVLEVAPETGEMALHNRAFLGRAVRYLAGEVGISQFLDIGSGLPTQGNVHEIARGITDDARVVYVDNDPLTRNHAVALLEGDEQTAFVAADARHPERILAEAAKMIDFSRPVAVLAVSVLHFIADDDDPVALVAGLMREVVPGSALAICHLTSEGMSAELAETIDRVYGSGPAPLLPRTREEIGDMFGGLGLVEPGLVDVQHWRNDDVVALGPMRMLAAVARVP